MIKELMHKIITGSKLFFHIKKQSLMSVNEKPVQVTSVGTSTGIGEGLNSLIRTGVKTSMKLEKEAEKTEEIRRDLLLAMIEIADSLERILSQAGTLTNNEDMEKLTGHIFTTARQLDTILKRRDVTSFDTVGKIADPAVTEVIDEEECEGCADGEVIRESGKGYLYKDQLLRRARVIIARQKGGK